MSLLPGVDALKAQLEEQNRATETHRQYEGDALRALQIETQQIKGFAEATNGKVQKHTIELAVIEEARKQAAIIDAARDLAANTKSASRVSLKQGLEVAAFSLLGGGVVTAVIYLALGLSTK